MAFKPSTCSSFTTAAGAFPSTTSSITIASVSAFSGACSCCSLILSSKESKNVAAKADEEGKTFEGISNNGTLDAF